MFADVKFTLKTGLCKDYKMNVYELSISTNLVNATV